MTDLIPPMEAFRIILRAIYPENPRLPNRIKSYEFFRKAQEKYGFTPAGEYSPPIWTRPVPDHAWLPFQATHLLRAGVWQRKIRLHGEREGEQPAMIPVQHCAEGHLDVFTAMLEIGIEGRPDYYRYRRVWCSRDDVLALVAEVVPQVNSDIGIPRSPDDRAPSKKRRLPKREAFDAAVAELYPDRLPDVSDLENQQLARAIQGWLKSNKPAITMSDRQILRLAGRLP